MFGKWHVGITAYDKDGKPIHQNGLEAVKRIDYSKPLGADPWIGDLIIFGTCPVQLRTGFMPM